MRPTFHFTPPWGWMNDPCGPGYDAETLTYHLFFQWNPKGCEWGNISWGHAVSRDLIHWEIMSKTPALQPDTPYDKAGVFSGCFSPSGLRGEIGQLTVIYTSVSKLPISWTLPHVRGSETLSLATSNDHGNTWVKYRDNPILGQEPEGIDVTGWRDPYLASWESMDRIRGKHSLYGIISGGIAGQGPRLFMYAVETNDLTKWNYLGPLLELPQNYSPSQRWSGDFGVNWECANFMTLRGADNDMDVVIISCEGGKGKEHIEKHNGSTERSTRWCLWMSGTLSEVEAGGVRLIPEAGGILDHGCLYAANSFHDPNGDRRVVWGWLPELDVNLAHCNAKGWNGSLALPREVFLLEIPNVVKSLHTPLEEVSSISLCRGPNGASLLRTVGIRPLPDLACVRSCEAFIKTNMCIPESPSQPHIYETPIKSLCCEIELSIDVREGCDRVGVHVRHTKDLSTRTTISFDPGKEEISVDRLSSRDPSISQFNERGSHTLFTIAQPPGAGDAMSDKEFNQEKLNLRIFCDQTILEVFANDRFALATYVYVDAPDALGISCFAEGTANCVTVESMKIWKDLSPIMAKMPS